MNGFRRVSAFFYHKNFAACLYSTGSIQSLVKHSASKFQPVFSSVLCDPPLSQNRKVNILDAPLTIKSHIFDVPKLIIPVQDNYNGNNIIEEPTKIIEKQAARLIVIRRNKMKRHKLKKLRLKMKIVWGKIRQRREAKKEKAFQAELMCQVKEAEKFDAVKYVKEKLSKTRYDPTEDMWKGKSAEEVAYLKNLSEQRKRIKAFREQSLESRKRINLKVSDYKF